MTNQSQACRRCTAMFGDVAGGPFWNAKHLHVPASQCEGCAAPREHHNFAPFPKVRRPHERELRRMSRKQRRFYYAARAGRLTGRDFGRPEISVSLDGQRRADGAAMLKFAAMMRAAAHAAEALAAVRTRREMRLEGLIQ